ncbi:UDP-glucose 4-epimerase GalE [Patescibacteria group bacterium]|nr:UDP-glucose 4-epimerase GalE [Patescibacteria group bacterium]
MPKKILITGGAGYIGSHAVKLFLEKGFEVASFDNFSRGFREPLKILKKYGKLKSVEGDLRNKKDIRKVFKENKIDAVAHFAALCSVNESMERPGLYFENNFVGSFNLFEAMREAGVKNIIFSSTCAAYGETEYLPVDEKHPQNPANPYGESKMLTERMLRWYGELHDFKCVIFRYFNVCGADMNGEIGDGKKPSSLLVQNAVRGAMGIEPFSYTCQKVDTPDGSPIRDYIDAEDLARAHYLAYGYLSKKNSQSEIFNLGNGAGWSVKEIVSKVEQEFGKKMNKKSGEARKGEYAKIYADASKAFKILKWKPEKNIEESILSLRKWYEKHPRGYDN